MSYHGLIPLVKQYLYSMPKELAPTLLEVGIDRGVTLVPIVAFLARTREKFAVLGVDVKVQEQVQIMLANLDLMPMQQAHCVQDNSLTVLPKMVEQGMKFDVILLDGDHNYYTVAEELKSIESLVKPSSIILVDDYDGRWSDKDLWYAERAGYEDVTVATNRVETEKHGVKAAVDEWLSAHPEWKKIKPVEGEPVVLMREVVTSG